MDKLKESLNLKFEFCKKQFIRQKNIPFVYAITFLKKKIGEVQCRQIFIKGFKGEGSNINSACLKIAMQTLG